MKKQFIDYIKLVSKVFNIPVFLVDQKKNILFESANNTLINPCYLNKKDSFFLSLNYPDSELTTPTIQTTIFLEKFILIPVYNDNEFFAHLIIGPYLFSNISEKKIQGFSNDTLNQISINSLHNYYDSIQVVDIEKLQDITIIINKVFNNILIKKELISIKNNALEYSGENENPLIKSQKMTDLIYEKKHHDLFLEKKYLSHITEGNLEELKLFNEIDEEEIGVLSNTSFIRSKKNAAISLITLGTRAAIQGGLNSEIALSMSDLFIQRIEEHHQIQEINYIFSDALISLTSKVAEIKKNNYSKPILECINYIERSRFESISLSELANFIDASPSYLSTLFKKETNLTFGEYIQKTKIDEAKLLLKFTDIPISEIGSELNYSDQSHFTKNFKKLTSLTPRQYRTFNHQL